MAFGTTKNTYPINNPYTKRAIEQKNTLQNNVSLIYQVFHLIILSEFTRPIEKDLVGI